MSLVFTKVYYNLQYCWSATEKQESISKQLKMHKWRTSYQIPSSHLDERTEVLFQNQSIEERK